MRNSRIMIGTVAVMALGAGAVAGIGGIWPSTGDTHPPCQQLPTVVEADAALKRNQFLVDELRALGKGVRVEVGKPCPPGQDRALVEVSYRSTKEHDAIAGLLVDRTGFGVPVHLVEH